ncbi:MAG TPA: C40 family peptidase [Pyrinomonadaceae bacterium]|nr:C40 family peptidase [Pyrinomonadaceae bacterium]
MFVQKSFPLALAVCFALVLTTATAANAQTDPARPRQVTQTVQPDGTARLETDVYLVSEAASPSVEIAKPLAKPLTTTVAPRPFRLNHLLMTAIEDRLGAPYVLGTEGPYRFDCSGFVWSVFQEAGVHFERTSARHFWSQFQPAEGDDRYQFGTLVFFNNLGHVGIVADENGFYHASSSKGVTYSTFDGYWGKRITGFRRIPVPPTLTAE